MTAPEPFRLLREADLHRTNILLLLLVILTVVQLGFSAAAFIISIYTMGLV